MISLDEALNLTLAQVQPLAAERVPLTDAAGRVLAAPLTARGAAPRTAVSAMDGYAVREADLAVLPTRLAVQGRTFAGADDAGVLAEGTCCRIFTGAPLPRGADRVVIQEQVSIEEGWAIFETEAGLARHVRGAGSDFEAGAEVLMAGTRLGAREMVVAAAADRAVVDVVRQPRVAILSTGDELVEPGQALETPGAIPDSVSFGVAAMVETWGGKVIKRQRLVDDEQELAVAARQALERTDLIVVTGGASVGERDFAKAMFAPVGLEPVFSKVAIKPGKPVWLGRAGGRLVLGLPGNPTSALVTARLFLAPLVAGMSGQDPAGALAWRQDNLVAPLSANGDRETLERGRRTSGGVEPLSNQESGAQRVLALADVLIRRSPGDGPVNPGCRVSVLDF